jgi:hypothetical protein
MTFDRPRLKKIYREQQSYSVFLQSRYPTEVVEIR